jgi:prepilin-type N-terminal cleavage/methylation domain-containing protein
MMKKRKKTAKGTTLIECIIALAVFAMLGTILVLTSSTINALVRSSNNINKKVTRESPIAEVQDTSNATIAGNVTIKVTMNGKERTVTGSRYETDEYTVDDEGNRVKVDPDDNLNIDFIKIDPIS